MWLFYQINIIQLGSLYSGLNQFDNFKAHNKGVSSLVMLSEGTLLSGGEKDRKIAAWDSLQNYKRITDTKVCYQ